MFRRIALLVLISLICGSSYSQKKSFLKLNLTNEFIPCKSFIPGYGISFEKQISIHSGIETGIGYRPYKVRGSRRGGDLFYNHVVRENHLSFPILYKYYSQVINFSIGPTIDIYDNWTIHKMDDLKVISGNEERELGIGILAGASKEFKLNSIFYLEPEIHFNSLLSIKRNYVGAGISFKCKL